MSDPTLSVVICTRNRAGMLEDLLDSLTRQTLAAAEFEVVVVDDGSGDNTSDVVRAAGRAEFAVLYEPQEHQGVNAARNRGLEVSSGRIVCFRDDDEVLPPEHLASVVNLLALRSETDGVGGPLSDYGGAMRVCEVCSWDTPEPVGQGERRVKRLVGGNMAIRRAAFDAVGPFDAAISGRGDENEWFDRAADLAFLYDPGLWVWHRRDQFGLLDLARHAFRQGLSVPLYARKSGASFRPRPIRMVRLLMHALIRRCPRGWVGGMRDAGSTWAWGRGLFDRNQPVR